VDILPKGHLSVTCCGTVSIVVLVGTEISEDVTLSILYDKTVLDFRDIKQILNIIHTVKSNTIHKKQIQLSICKKQLYY